VPLKVANLPPVQAAWLKPALVMAPIRALSTLAMVLEWKEPSMVTGHLTVANPENSKDLKVPLICWLLAERVLAEAELTAAESMSAAVSAASTSFADLRM
jgi:hypothetical protein